VKPKRAPNSGKLAGNGQHQVVTLAAGRLFVTPTDAPSRKKLIEKEVLLVINATT
jgi:hypothetical protein